MFDRHHSKVGDGEGRVLILFRSEVSCSLLSISVRVCSATSASPR